jgi:LuxR family transcriptional regulator, regulator of acetate metabolism
MRAAALLRATVRAGPPGRPGDIVDATKGGDEAVTPGSRYRVIASAGIAGEGELVSTAVRELARRTRFPIAFGGLTTDDAVHVSAIHGARTPSIDGLVVQAHRGLGGRALVERRPRLALDYRTARTITHDYDRAILGEGIATLFAVPVVVAGIARGVLYCGSWAPSSVGDVVARPAVAVADELATELRVRTEVERRLSATPPAPDLLPAAAAEEVRESYAEVRSIAASVADPALRTRLREVERRLAALTSRPKDSAASEVRLSPRELDVLACAALGATNGEIAASLTLRETTVKSYLQAAMSKLDASTRHAAVARARRMGILP